MAIGQKLAEARDRMNITQEQLALGINYSTSAVGKWEKESRRMPKHMFSQVAETIDDVEFYFETWNEAAGEVAIPFLNGDHVDQHPSSMAFLVKKETNEALDQINRVCWVKPIHTRTDTEREEMQRLIFELLDAAASTINLVAVVCREYRFSMRKIFQQWRMTLKARRLQK